MSYDETKEVPVLPDLGFYYHYKHDPSGEINNYAYEVTGFARHTEDKSFLVLYIPLYENEWFKPVDFQARPLTMFMEEVSKDGVIKKRFTKITDPKVVAELTAIRDRIYS